MFKNVLRTRKLDQYLLQTETQNSTKPKQTEFNDIQRTLHTNEERLSAGTQHRCDTQHNQHSDRLNTKSTPKSSQQMQRQHLTESNTLS